MQAISLLIYFLTYVAMFGLGWMSKINKCHRLFDDDAVMTQKPGMLIGIHLTGIIWLAIAPLLQLNLSVVQVLFGNSVPNIISVFTFGFVFLFAMLVAFKLGKNINSSTDAPSETNQQSRGSLTNRYFIIRALFIISYELWFRGFLLFESIGLIRIPAAVVLNISLYTLLHFFKSKKEILVCIPFGLLLCFLSIYFNAAWPAIILHTGFTLVYELNIYRNHIYSLKIVRS